MPSLDNALYYTLSTITQSLAGVGGLIVAFALYRMQSFDATAREATFQLRQRHLRDELLAQVAAQEEYNAFLARYCELEPNRSAGVIGPDFAAYFLRLTVALSTVARLKQALRRVLITTGCVMGSTVAALPLVPWLVVSTVASYSVLGVVVLAFILCLNQFLNLVRSMVPLDDA